MARTIDAHRQQLDTLHARIEQVSTILEEHDITSSILDQLIKSISTGRAAARLSIGSGVTLNYVHEGDSEGTAMVDIGSGVFGEKPWTEAHSLSADPVAMARFDLGQVPAYSIADTGSKRAHAS